jgi:predicted RNase H-like nuclease (RuvC/YqgF family)
VKHDKFLAVIPALRRGIVILFVLTLATSTFAQSIADVARKERERQQTSKSKVVVRGVGGSSATTVQSSPSSSSTAGTASAMPKPITATDSKGRDEQFWRTAFQNARDDLKRAESKVQILDLRLKELNTQLLQQSDVYNRENRIGAETTAAQKAMEDARKELDQAKKKITDLEEELRKSGGPPGWAR